MIPNDNNLSIYHLSTWLISPLKGGSQDKAFRVEGDLTLPSPSAPCLFIGENRGGAFQTSHSVPFDRLLQAAENMVVVFLQPQPQG